MKKNSLLALIFSLTLSVGLSSNLLAQPDLPELNGVLVHSSMNQSPISLSDSVWSNCQTINSVKVTCDVDSATLKVGNKTMTFNSGIFMPSANNFPFSIYYLRGDFELSSNVKDLLTLAIIIHNNGKVDGYVKLKESNITEQIVFKNID